MSPHQWLLAHPFYAGVLTMLIPPLVGAFINWLTWKGTPEAWAAYRAVHPRKATAILWVRMLLPHLRQIPKIAAFIPPPSVKPELSESNIIVKADDGAAIAAEVVPAPEAKKDQP